MNALIGQKLSIVTAKAQTTRHRVLSLINEQDFQMVLLDTPGIMTVRLQAPASKLLFLLRRDIMHSELMPNMISDTALYIQLKNKKSITELCV